MDMFARTLMQSAQPADYSRIAHYYENRGEYEKVRRSQNRYTSRSVFTPRIT